MNNLLEIKHLNLFFKSEEKEFQALYDINLSFERGQIHSIVGESGCGKSMTAMSIMYLLPSNAYIQSGEILYNGQDLLKLNNKQMREIRGNKIALIPQDPMSALNPLYTIKNQLIETICAHSKVSKSQAMRKVREVMNLVKIPNIDKNLDSYPHEFSGGMRQRVLIAMALICSPELIIADEPTTALDVTVQKQIMDLILEIQKELGLTVILISHDLALISNYANTITVMYAGDVVEKSDLNRFLKKTLHPYSIGLLESLPNSKYNEKLTPIIGAPPSLKDEIFGCKFHPRCKYFQEGVCNVEKPLLVEKVENHWCACYKVNDGRTSR